MAALRAAHEVYGPRVLHYPPMHESPAQSAGPSKVLIADS
jgi:hypothetical protein